MHVLEEALSTSFGPRVHEASRRYWSKCGLPAIAVSVVG
jgi:hypothetical protein